MPDFASILFLCTGNSCRSQMAEGWARHIGGTALIVQSAGLEAHGVNSRAIEVMREIGIDISEHKSTIVDDRMLHKADIVVTVCGHADEQCPVLPPGITRLHWPLTDPAKATGTDEEIMREFRAVRDEIGHRVNQLVGWIERGQGR